ncbi:ABC transporter ATP-binding protein [bacterium]|nr:ABC transporter ATP-binding protein [candidate division CSSED10-310 bacterium]
MQDQPDISIRIRDLRKAFGSKKVLQGIDLDIMRGESIAVIGASGTGKSVLIKHIIGLLRPDGGSIEVDGIDVLTLDQAELNEFRGRFGMLFQGGALFDSMTVFENVAFPLRHRTRMTTREIKERVHELLEMTGMEQYMDRWPSDLSGGMKKRVGLSRALAIRPSIMLYDEPTTGLDPVMGGIIDHLIIKTRDTLNVTSITITHDMRSASRIANRIAMLYKGTVVQAGTPAEIMKSAIPEVSEFVRDRTAMLSVK